LDRRGIDHKTFWHTTIGKAITLAETGAKLWTDTGCSRAAVTAQLVDIRLGLPAARDPYEAIVRAQLPAVLPVVDRLVKYLGDVDLWDKAQHRQALQTVFAELKALGEAPAKD
jgi:hypothetical protein